MVRRHYRLIAAALACARLTRLDVRGMRLFGTDWPHVNMDGSNVPNDGDLVDLIPEWIEDTAKQKQILVDSPRSLYAFPAAN